MRVNQIDVKYTLVCGKFDAGSVAMLWPLKQDYYYGELLREKTARARYERNLAKAREFVHRLKTSPSGACEHARTCPNDHALWSYRIVALVNLGFNKFEERETIDEWSFESEHPLSAEMTEATSHIDALVPLQGPAIEATRAQLHAFLKECYRLRLRQAIYEDTVALGQWLPSMRETLGRGATLLDEVEVAIQSVYTDPAALAEELARDLGLSPAISS
jgi:hypothetical protein